MYSRNSGAVPRQCVLSPNGRCGTVQVFQHLAPSTSCGALSETKRSHDHPITTTTPPRVFSFLRCLTTSAGWSLELIPPQLHNTSPPTPLHPTKPGWTRSSMTTTTLIQPTSSPHPFPPLTTPQPTSSALMYHQTLPSRIRHPTRRCRAQIAVYRSPSMPHHQPKPECHKAGMILMMLNSCQHSKAPVLFRVEGAHAPPHPDQSQDVNGDGRGRRKNSGKESVSFS